MRIGEDSNSYNMAKDLFEEIYGYPPKIIEGEMMHELLVAALQKGVVYGANHQEDQMFSKKEVEKMLISCKNRFGGSELQDYTHDDDVLEYFKKDLEK